MIQFHSLRDEKRSDSFCGSEREREKKNRERDTSNQEISKLYNEVIFVAVWLSGGKERVWTDKIARSVCI